MKNFWFEDLEQKLDEKLSEFLSRSPYQDALLSQQKESDEYQAISNYQNKIKEDAQKIRLELLTLATTIKEWKSRALRAKQAGANNLSKRADQHLTHLMKLGRDLWEKLGLLGLEFKKTENQKLNLTRKKTLHTKVQLLEEDWNKFEAQEELDLLRKKKRPTN